MYQASDDLDYLLSGVMSQMRPAVCRILIADDHQAMRCGIRSLLQGVPGYDVVAEAADGRQALAMVLQIKPDLAIIDYSMPLMNGLDLTRAIRRGSPATEILIYTMHEHDGALVDVLKAGARGYVLKSDRASQLKEAVTALSNHMPYFSGDMHERMLSHFISKYHSIDERISLTPRERQIVQLVSEGKMNKQTSHFLAISVKTVETHRASIMRKLKLASTADLVKYALRHNIVSL